MVEAMNTVSAASTTNAKSTTTTLDMENGEHSFNQGYVKLHRRILDNPWLHQHPNRLSLWVHLLLLATHRKRRMEFKGKNIILEPGQLITGRKFLARQTGISESEVQRILAQFEGEREIEQRISSANRLITMLNWVDDQQVEQRLNTSRTTAEQRLNNTRTTVEHLPDTYKNEKNVENGKKVKNAMNEEEAPPSSSSIQSSDSFIGDDYEDEDNIPDYLTISEWEDRLRTPLGDLLHDEVDWALDFPQLIETSDKDGSGGNTGLNSRAPAAASAAPPVKAPAPADKTPIDIEKIKAVIQQLAQTDDAAKCLRSQGEYFVEYYHRVAAHFGHKLKTDIVADARCCHKICEQIGRLRAYMPSDTVKIWIVWYFMHLPPHTSHPKGLYPSVMVNSLSEFLFRAEALGMLTTYYRLKWGLQQPRLDSRP